MNEQQEEVLRNLRNAAENDQWAICLENIGKLLPDLSQTDVIEMIVRQAQRFLSDLSHCHPQDEELTKSIQTFTNIASVALLEQQGQRIDRVLDKYWDWPGVSNFRNTFKGISKPQQYYSFIHSGEYNDIVVSLLSRMIEAIAMNAYWNGDPEFSKVFFGPDIKAALFWGLKEHNDPKYVELRKLLWTEVANEIETKLQTQ